MSDQWEQGAAEAIAVEMNACIFRGGEHSDDLDCPEAGYDSMNEWCEDCIIRKLRILLEQAITERRELTEHIEVLQDKVDSYARSCACSYDAAGDVCATHSPMLTRATRRAEAAERALAELREAVRQERILVGAAPGAPRPTVRAILDARAAVDALLAQPVEARAASGATDPDPMQESETKAQQESGS